MEIALPHYTATLGVFGGTDDVAVAHNSKTVETYRTGARGNLHWHNHWVVVGHGNSVVIVNYAVWC